MPKYKAIRSFYSESLGPIVDGDVKEITVTKADAINKHSKAEYGLAFLERVEEPKKAGKK
ncbi:hypothetical protein vBBceSLY5_0009 [Bacillus phage vB_BceS_LY5]|uniref:hypothetical protein n=1 Tax=Bacillus phage vB_BceS_LY5 TaxID=2996058 RepID=UPI004054B19F|nr:hypothetical protein vBBceSLY5_0009 [Bacillus phage vB_BceS_LY5]